MWLIGTIFSAALLHAARALEDFEYISQSCIDVTDCSECINSVNNGWFDTSKCIPIVPSLYGGDENSTSTKSITCASWQTVESNKYEIDLKCSNDLVPQETKDQLLELRYMLDWAFYVFSAKETDNLLADMVIIDNTEADTRAILGYDIARNNIIISFRGSAGLLDWLYNFNFPKSDYNKPGCESCSVHTGFLNSYESLSTEVIRNLSTLYSKYPEAAIMVTGHSLGAAQSVLGALDLQLAGYTPLLYTYGCPRVGNQNFVNFFNEKIDLVNIRVVYHKDPVPNVPPITFNFHHGGTKIHFYNCRDYLVYPKHGDEGEIIDLLASGEHTEYLCIR
jgi:hypothetical protein